MMDKVKPDKVDCIGVGFDCVNVHDLGREIYSKTGNKLIGMSQECTHDCCGNVLGCVCHPISFSE